MVMLLAVVLMLAGGWSICRLWDSWLGYKRVRETDLYITAGCLELAVDNEIFKRVETLEISLHKQALDMMSYEAAHVGYHDPQVILANNSELRAKTERIASWLNALTEIRGCVTS